MITNLQKIIVTGRTKGRVQDPFRMSSARGHSEVQDRKMHVCEVARIAQRAENDGVLSCKNAMLFDGGHSVNFFVEGGGTKVSISNGRAPVLLYATER